MADPITPDDLRALANRCSNVSPEGLDDAMHSLRAAADRIEELEAELAELRGKLMRVLGHLW